MPHLTRPAAFLLVLATSAALVSAQPPATEDVKLRSERLFQEGRRLWADGKLLDACAKFRESRDAMPSVGNLLNLGRCAQSQQQLASAYRYYEAAAQIADGLAQPDRAETARALARKAKNDASELRIVLASDIPEVAVRLNGKLVEPATLTEPLLLDPGTYHIAVEAPGYRSFETSQRLGDKADRQVVTVTLAPEARAVPTAEPSALVVPPPTASVSTAAPPGASPRVAPPPSASASATPPPVVPERSAGMSPVRIGGIALAAVGVVALGLGTVAGIAAAEQEKDLQRLCPDHACDANGLKKRDEAIRVADASTALVVLGSALGAGGVTLIVLGDRPLRDAAPALAVIPWAGPQLGGLLVGGAF